MADAEGNSPAWENGKRGLGENGTGAFLTLLWGLQSGESVRKCGRGAARHCGALIATGRRDPTVLGQLRHNEDRESVVVRNSAIMSGAPTFRGTRVLVRTLFEYLEAGHNMERFLEGFPTVSREQALQALEEARESLLASH